MVVQKLWLLIWLSYDCFSAASRSTTTTSSSSWSEMLSTYRAQQQQPERRRQLHNKDPQQQQQRQAMVSQKCVKGTNEMTDTEKFRKALRGVIQDIRVTDDACHRRYSTEDDSNKGNATKTSEAKEDSPVTKMVEGPTAGMVCIFDETYLASGEAYAASCKDTGGSIHISDMIVSCIIQKPPKKAEQSDTNNNKEEGKLEAASETFEYQYKNMEFCFDPISCTETDISQAIQQEANSLLDYMEHGIQILESFYEQAKDTIADATGEVKKTAAGYSIQCQAKSIVKQPIIKPGETEVKETKPEEEQKKPKEDDDKKSEKEGVEKSDEEAESEDEKSSSGDEEELDDEEEDDEDDWNSTDTNSTGSELEDGPDSSGWRIVPTVSLTVVTSILLLGYFQI